LIDDHTIFRESLIRLLAAEPGIEVVGHCATIAEAQKIIENTSVHVALLDYDLGEEAGTNLLKHLKKTGSSVRVLMLTAGMIASATLNAVDDGAAGVILKHSGTHQLLEAIHHVSAGGVWWDTSILRSALSEEKEKNGAKSKARDLTDKQRLVLRCILDGLTNKEIAVRLKSTETAVKASIQELFSKAGVRSRSQLVRVAIEHFSSDWLKNRP
jgi:DNA-binding NarL/FixJ family response regulator